MRGGAAALDDIRVLKRRLFSRYVLAFRATKANIELLGDVVRVSSGSQRLILVAG